MQNIKITSAEEFAFHALISVVAGAVLAGVTAGLGLIYTQGINVPVMLTAGFAGFGSAFSVGFLAFRNNPQVVQAEIDVAGQAAVVASQVEARIGQQLELRFNGLLNLFQQSPVAQPPVVVNVAHPADVATQAQPAVQVSPTGINPVSSSAPVQQQQFKALNFPTDTAPLAALGKAPQ